MKAKDVQRYAESKGWVHQRTTASHFIYKRPGVPYIISIPKHAAKDVASGTLATLLKQIDGTWKGPHA
jgi:predicted RNA binding protein YcfA (HicA-like mRNA interferase family)